MPANGNPTVNDVSVDFNLAGIRPRITQPHNPLKLNRGDSAKVALGAGLSPYGTIQQILFFDSKHKTNQVASWSRGEGLTPGFGAFVVSANDDGSVSITDNESPAGDDAYWYSVVVQVNGLPLTADPELINRPTP
jgi:hypothetical protein